MQSTCLNAIIEDPLPPLWLEQKLPDAWPDLIYFKTPRGMWKLLKAMMQKPRPVELPDTMPGKDLLPDYLLQEFHRLPNGNYSNRMTTGYIRGFEAAMLGHMGRIRRRIATGLRHCSSVLDVGCGGGGLAGTLSMAGIPDVWGLEPSPYLLQHAALRYPGIKFVQGIAENLPFRNERFDAVGACFLFHELPPEIADQTLREFNRVLKKGGVLAISEPSAPQLYENNYLTLLRKRGPFALYFKLLARFVFEPYVDQWHQRDYAKWFKSFGFQFLSDEVAFPARHFLAQKI